jgi:hypothetical protein
MLISARLVMMVRITQGKSLKSCAKTTKRVSPSAVLHLSKVQNDNHRWGYKLQFRQRLENEFLELPSKWQNRYVRVLLDSGGDGSSNL